MARNRKAQTVAVRFGPAVKACVLCLLIGGSGVGYVWQKEQIVRLGQEFRQRELRLLSLEKDNEKLRKQLAYFRSPQFLEMRIKELKLDLALPQPAQIWHLAESAAELPGEETAPLPASRNDQALALH